MHDNVFMKLSFSRTTTISYGIIAYHGSCFFFSSQVCPSAWHQENRRFGSARHHH